MSGCDSRNSPIVGSSVKPCTPCPVVYACIVLEPYRMYPAATCARPFCRQSASDPGPRFVAVRRWIEKIVPIETLTSMLLEPSSGSYSSTYFPPRRSARTCTGIGSSSSSEATTQTRPVCSTLWRTVSWANRSSFCCTSPCTLITPTSPRISVSPARRTWREMILAARQRSYSRFDSSPVASGCSRSCSMMKRSIVMTDVGDCERAMTRDGECDSAPLIGAEHGDPTFAQPGQRLGRGMAVAIAPAHADHGILRLQLLEPAVGGRAARSVVTHFQQCHSPHLPREMGLGRHPGISRKQQPSPGIRHEQHDRFLIDVGLARRPCRVRAQHVD